MEKIQEIQLVGHQHPHYILLTAIAVAAIGYVVKVLTSPVAKIPGPWYSKFTDRVLLKEFLEGRRPKYVHQLHEEYGPVVRIGPNEIDVMDLHSVKEIHAVKATYVKAPSYRFLAADGTENLFNTIDVDFHRRHRRLLQGPFSETGLKVFHPIVEQRVSLAIQRMEEEMAERGVVDVFKWWLFMATDVIGELTFGESFRMLELKKKNEYTLNLEKVASVLGKTTSPLLARLAAVGIHLPGYGDTENVSMKILEYAKQSLERYRKLVENDPDKPIPTLFTRLFKGQEDENLTQKEILDEAQVYIVAGSDTTAVTLTYLVWRVCQNPKIQKKLVRELQKLPDDYHDHDLLQIPYLTQVIDETFRIHSPVPSGLPRVVPRGGATMCGQYIPAGSIVCTQSWSIHRNPTVFPDPEKFEPERWASPTKDMKDSLIPFGAGSRICIGLHLARLELRLATARFFRAFPNAKVSTLEGMCDEVMEQVPLFLSPPKGKRCMIECA